MNVLEYRAAVVGDVHPKERIIEIIAVPWETPAPVPFLRGEIYAERFMRGSFDGAEQRVGRVMANREHRKGETVGPIVLIDPKHQGGLLTHIKVAKTARGDDTLGLAEVGGVFASIGFRLMERKHPSDPPSQRVDTRARTRDVLRSYFDHLGMVEDPAYTGTDVLAVRDQAGPEGASLNVATPLLDQFYDDEVLLWARSRLMSCGP